jgi:hypothetical protein
VLLAPGRKPGDALVAQIVQAQVFDVVTEIDALAAAIDHPADLSAAARWLDPSLAPEAVQGPTVVERIRDRPVPIAGRPTRIAVAGVASGVGVTTLATAVAGLVARPGHATALIEANPAPALPIITQSKVGDEWLPHLTVYPAVSLQVMREVEQTRRHLYTVVDLGVPPRDLLHQIDADLTLVVLPAEAHRWVRVRHWLHEHADAVRAAAGSDQDLDMAIRQDRLLPRAARYMVLNPSPRDLRDLAEAWEAATEACIPPPAEPLFSVPVADRGSWPPGYRHRDEPLDEALSHLLAPVLPDGPAPRRGLFAGLRSRPKHRRLPPAAEARAPEPVRPAPAVAPRAPAARVGGQSITVKVGTGESGWDRVAGVLETVWRLALAAGAAYGLLYVMSRIPGSPPWALHGYGWAHGVLSAGWRLVGGH